MSLPPHYQQKTIKNYLKFLAKSLKDQFISITNQYRYLPKSTFTGVNRLLVFVYLNNDNVKRHKTQRYHLLKGIIKNYNIIITGKNFYGQPIDSDIKQQDKAKIILLGVCWIMITLTIIID